MTNKRPTYTISFDGKEYSKEEQEYLIFRFFSCLMKLEAEQYAKKVKTKKEQKRIENDFMNFGPKVLIGVLNSSATDKIDTRTFETLTNTEL